MTYGFVGPRPSLRLKGRTKYLKHWTYFISMICYRCFKPLQTIFHGCYVNEVVSFVNVANVSFDVNENVACSGFASIFGHCVNNFCTINKVPSLQVGELWFRKLDYRIIIRSLRRFINLHKTLFSTGYVYSA